MVKQLQKKKKQKSEVFINPRITPRFKTLSFPWTHIRYRRYKRI